VPESRNLSFDLLSDCARFKLSTSSDRGPPWTERLSLGNRVRSMGFLLVQNLKPVEAQLGHALTGQGSLEKVTDERVDPSRGSYPRTSLAVHPPTMLWIHASAELRSQA